MDKPLGLGSTQAVAAVKRNLREAGRGKMKVGHGGTLDPLATGVLPIALGEATKLCGRMLDASKEYDFTISFGTQTAGLDAEGEVVFSSDTIVTREDWDAILPQFIGEIAQVPPMYSALKKDGKPLYEYARAGIEIERAARQVQILNMTTVTFEYPFVTLSVTCSKGTYIRTLAEDIGTALGVGAHLRGLTRTAVGDLQLKDAMTLDAFEALSDIEREQVLLPLDALMQNTPSVNLDESAAARFVQGQRLKMMHADAELVRVYWQEILIGLASVTRDTLSPSKVLMTALPLN